jgi:predicted ATPase
MASQITTPDWYVIAGGPSSGKTTLWSSIGKMGYYTIREPAREVADENMAKGVTLEELRADEARWNQMVLKKNIEIEEAAPRDRIVFFDRALPDCIAYFRFRGQPAESIKAIEAIAKGRYKKIFFLEKLQIYDVDNLRTEDEEMAVKLSSLILSAYHDLGYPIVRIPAVPVEERVKLVLSNL